MSTESRFPLSGLLSFFQLPQILTLWSDYPADDFIELVKFVHNEAVTIPNDKRKIVAEIKNINEGEYYILTLNWQSKGVTLQQWATASVFVYDDPDDARCKIEGYAELTPMILLFGLFLFVIALLVYVMTNVGGVAFVIAFILFVMATRGARKWRNALVSQFWEMAMIQPGDENNPDGQAEFDEHVERLVEGIKQGT